MQLHLGESEQAGRDQFGAISVSARHKFLLARPLYRTSLACVTADLRSWQYVRIAYGARNVGAKDRVPRGPCDRSDKNDKSETLDCSEKYDNNNSETSDSSEKSEKPESFYRSIT